MSEPMSPAGVEGNDYEMVRSPDGRYVVTLNVWEVRMSHWIKNPTLSETGSNRAILYLDDTLWSADDVQWSEDSRTVTLAMRYYNPGNTPSVRLRVHLDTATADVESDADTATIPISTVRDWLSDFLQARGIK